MTTQKTKPGKEPVETLLAGIEPEERRRDAERLVELFREKTGEEPVVWGGSMIGFGHYHYRYKSGREGDWFKSGFAPRKNNLSLYLISRPEGCEEKLAKLGKYKMGKGCIYIQRLSDVDEEALGDLIAECHASMGDVAE